MQDIESEIRDIIAEIVEKDPAEITPEAKFFEDLGMDSMMALEILAAIEKKYKISIPEEKLMQLTTLKDTVAVARGYLNQNK
ncbi:MAG: acyl carrier protein [Candidatus Omnitrophica bacterium]|nr:acyl carrier protein [Candidatus Omnitrophota bacterium]MBL7210358.1 acyl carrier protein [Candidatus Omnitrophota bacterium]